MVLVLYIPLVAGVVAGVAAGGVAGVVAAGVAGECTAAGAACAPGVAGRR